MSMGPGERGAIQLIQIPNIEENEGLQSNLDLGVIMIPWSRRFVKIKLIKDCIHN